MVPHGFRFNPTDEELIQILDRKVSGHEMPLHFIIQTNIYEHEPQDLEWNQTAALSNDERYYYCKRENDSREVIGRGWWKATSHVKKVCADENLVGYKRPLTFHRFKDKDKSRNSAIKTNWIMHEYSLESTPSEWRLCKIKYKGKPSIQEEMETIKKSYSSRNSEIEAGSSSSVNMQFDNSLGQQQQQDTLPLDSSYYYPSYDEFNMQQLPQTSCDNSDHYDLLLSDSANYYCFEQQQHVVEHNEQPFPSLWSWQN